jgi:hypothetical protein
LAIDPLAWQPCSDLKPFPLDDALDISPAYWPLQLFFQLQGDPPLPIGRLRPDDLEAYLAITAIYGGMK